MLKDAVKELEDELEKIPPPKASAIKIHAKRKRKIKKKIKKIIDIEEGVETMEDIDVTYEKEIKLKKLDV